MRAATLLSLFLILPLLPRSTLVPFSPLAHASPVPV